MQAQEERLRTRMGRDFELCIVLPVMDRPEPCSIHCIHNDLRAEHEDIELQLIRENPFTCTVLRNTTGNPLGSLKLKADADASATA